jgi:putative nucleotidyltransferase with HDIG domain
MQTKLRIFVVDGYGLVPEDLLAALSHIYAVSTYMDGSEALDALHQSPPALVIIDEKTLVKKGHHILASKRDDRKLRSVPFIILGNTPDGTLFTGEAEAATDCYLQRPFAYNRLFEQISFSLSETVERDWSELPVRERKILTGTVDEFKRISRAIEEGKPLDIEAAKESCQLLADCVNESQYEGVLNNVKNHHNYTYVHSIRVATYLSVFGHAIGVRGDDLLILSAGGLLHDVGKVATPQHVLNKAGKLDDDEWVVMKQHAEQSGVILDATPDVNQGMRIIAEQHHEKLDGSGYPLELKASQLTELARMAAIVDIFSALTDKRSYKPAFSAEKAFAILQDMGSVIDQHLVRTFREVVA